MGPTRPTPSPQPLFVHPRTRHRCCFPDPGRQVAHWPMSASGRVSVAAPRERHPPPERLADLPSPQKKKKKKSRLLPPGNPRSQTSLGCLSDSPRRSRACPPRIPSRELRPHLPRQCPPRQTAADRKSTRLNSSHQINS